MSTAPKLRVRLRSCIVIPARLESTRLPRKLLLADTGKPLIQHTYEAASRATRPERVLVAADDSQLSDAVTRFGGEALLTDPALPSGSDRVAAAARHLDGVDVIVNVQGDEPEISAAAIDRAVELLEQNPQTPMATLACPIRDRQQLLDPNCVKVVTDANGFASYFSRSPIPAVRDWSDALLEANPPLFLQHIGLYAYRREFLLNLASLPPCPYEPVEKLEQLRVLHAGHKIAVAVVDEPTVGVDTEADYRAFVSRATKC